MSPDAVTGSSRWPSRRGVLRAGLASLLARRAFGSLPAGPGGRTAVAVLEGCDAGRMVIRPDGLTAYVAFVSSDEILVVDLRRGAIRSAIPMTEAGAFLSTGRILLSPGGEWLFVVNHGAANLAVIDTAGERVRKVLPLMATYGDCLKASASKLYAALGSSLAIVDLGDLTHRELRIPGVVFNSIALSPGRENLLYSVSGMPGGCYLQAIDVEKGVVERQAVLPPEYADPNGNVNRLLLDPSGHAAYVSYNWTVNGGGAGNLSKVNLETFQASVSTPIEEGVSDFAVHPETGKVYIAGSWEGPMEGRTARRLHISEWDPETQSVARRLPVSPSTAITCIQLDPSDPGFAYMAEVTLNLMRKVDLRTGAEVLRVRFFNGLRMPSCITAGGATAYIGCSKSPLIQKLDLASGQLSGSLPLPGGRTGAGACDYFEGKLYLNGGRTVEVIDARDGALLLRRQMPDGLSLSPKVTFFRGKIAAAAALPGKDPDRIVVLDAATLELTGTFPLELPLVGRIGGATASPDGSKLYVQQGIFYQTTILQILDSATLSPLRRHELSTSVFSGGAGDYGAFDEERRIAYLGGFCSVYMVHMDTEELLGTLNNYDVYAEMGRARGWATSAIRGLHLSPDRRLLYVVSWDGSSVYVHDLRAGKWLPRAIRGGLYPSDSALSPDGRWLYVVNAKSDNVARIGTETAELQEVTPLGGPVAMLNSTSFRHGASLESKALAPGCEVAIFDPEGVPFPGEVGPPVFTPMRFDDTGRAATELAGTRVLFDGVAAPVLSTFAAEVRVMAPYGIAGKQKVSVQLFRNDVESLPVQCAVAAAVPGIYTLDPGGQGQAVMLNEDGTPNGPANPAAKGSTVVFQATGGGQTEPPAEDGQLAAEPPAPLRQAVGVWIQGREAKVLFAGSVPGQVSGRFQVKVSVPMDVPSDPRVPLAMIVGDSAPSQDGVTMAVA